MRLITVMYLLLIGCATTKHKPITHQQKIDSYLKEFYKDFPYATKVSVKLERTMDSHVLGRCLPDVPIAIINPYKLRSLNDDQLKALVYHEVGHCALDLSHNESNTIMHPYILNLKFTIQDVIALRKLHRDTCDGKIPSGRKSAFGPGEPVHKSCFLRDSLEDSGD